MLHHIPDIICRGWADAIALKCIQIITVYIGLQFHPGKINSNVHVSVFVEYKTMMGVYEFVYISSLPFGRFSLSILSSLGTHSSEGLIQDPYASFGMLPRYF